MDARVWEKISLASTLGVLARSGQALAAPSGAAGASPAGDRLVRAKYVCLPNRLEAAPTMDEMLGVRGAPLRLRTAHVKKRAAMADGDVRAAGFDISSELPMSPGDATAHLGWTLHRASRNSCNLTRAQDKDQNQDQDQDGSGAGAPTRDALSIQYFCDGDSVHADMLGEPGADAAERGVPLHASDGPGVVVQLLGDDISTWVPWVLTQSVSPAQPLANEFTPLLWPRQQAEVGARGQ